MKFLLLEYNVELIMLHIILLYSSKIYPVAADDDVIFLKHSNDAMSESDELSMFEDLVDPLYYKSGISPRQVNGERINVSISLDIHIIREITSKDSSFNINFIITEGWKDSRLKFNASHNCIRGGLWHSQQIWKPPLFFENEKSAKIMSNSGEDVFVLLCSDGSVTLQYRITAELYCMMRLRKFPFDVQKCNINLQSWKYTIEDMILEWSPLLDGISPVTIQHKPDAEFTIKKLAYSEVIVRNLPRIDSLGFKEEYGSLVVTITLVREYGYYIIEFYSPALLLVLVSWITFWLEPSSAPARITLGTSVTLSLMTLASSGNETLPKVSYLKLIDWWFFFSIVFVFFSLLEFALVNSIHRGGANWFLKMLKYSIEEIKEHSGPLHHHKSDEIQLGKMDDKNNMDGLEHEQEQSQVTINPQNLAKTIDKISRVAFPAMFILFNIIYWTIVVI